MEGLVNECCHLGGTLYPILPYRVLLQVEKQSTITGVFRIDVDLSREKRAAYDVGGPELELVVDRKTVSFEQGHDHAAEQRAFGVDLRSDDDLCFRRADGGRQECQRRAEQQADNALHKRILRSGMAACRTRA